MSVDDRRAQLLQTSLRIIGADPWGVVTMADIAAAAGVSKPPLYHHYFSKSDLYLAAVRAAADELREATKPDLGLRRKARLLQALAPTLTGSRRQTSDPT